VNYKEPTRISVLKALLPYSRENLALSFKPRGFFNQLERQEQMLESTARSAYYRLIRQGFVDLNEDNRPILTTKAMRQLAPYTAAKLPNSQLMVIFDIAECERWKRSHLRGALKEFHFMQIQKSVWATSLDCRKYIEAEVDHLQLQNEVKLFEVISLK